MITVSIVIIKSYHCYQLLTDFYSSLFCSMQLRMQRKLLEILSYDLDVSITMDHILCAGQIVEGEL